jgi:hypothetical protein
VKLLYCGSVVCDEETLKRLVLLADEIGFMDRPGHTFNAAPRRGWGTVGVETPVRRMQPGEYPVTFSAYAPPSGPVSQLYQDYIEVDLGNPEFRSAVFEGLKSEAKFAAKLLPPKQLYSSGTGEDIRKAIVSCPEVRDANLPPVFDLNPRYRVSSLQDCIEAFAVLLVEMSLKVTDAILVSSHTGLVPVSDDHVVCRLIMLRAGSRVYLGDSPMRSPLLGLAVAKAVLPDQSLQSISMRQLFEYRKATKSAYAGWNIEIERLAAQLGTMSPEKVERELPRIIAVEVNPRIAEYRKQMESARDKLFGDLIKRLVAIDFPALFLTQVIGMGLAPGILTFLATLGSTATPALVDYVSKRRDINRTNSMAYLVGVAEMAKP